MLRLVHFSDIHLFEPTARWRARDMLTKRMTGYFNSKYLPRSKQFRKAEHVLNHLINDAYANSPDLVIFSGDATTLGVDEEFARAAQVMRVGVDQTPPAIAVPGNHDYYTTHSVKHGLFERHFAPWQQGERIDDEVYPFARQVGSLFVVALNSCQWNRWSWDSTGRVGLDQLLRLERLLTSEAAQGRTKVLVTHYPFSLADGRPERRYRRLRDLSDVLKISIELGVELWLHGHRHQAYVLPATVDRPITALCVGSGTMHDHWSYGEYLVENSSWKIRMRTYQPDTDCFKITSESVIALKPR